MRAAVFPSLLILAGFVAGALAGEWSMRDLSDVNQEAAYTVQGWEKKLDRRPTYVKLAGTIAAADLQHNTFVLLAVDPFGDRGVLPLRISFERDDAAIDADLLRDVGTGGRPRVIASITRVEGVLRAERLSAGLVQ